MTKESILFAKIAALKKSFESILYSQYNQCLADSVKPWFTQYESAIDELNSLNNELYFKVPEVPIPEPLGGSTEGFIYTKEAIHPLIRALDYILEVNSNARIGQKIIEKERPHKIFISHGRDTGWQRVQTLLEKDLGYLTLELSQEPHLGRTIIQKLSEESEKCKCAIIIMTGDDMIEDDNYRVRENVMHEIGFFQAKYGFGNVILLYEEGVNIPSNITGLGYVGFPKDSIDSSFQALARELKVLMA